MINKYRVTSTLYSHTSLRRGGRYRGVFTHKPETTRLIMDNKFMSVGFGCDTPLAPLKRGSVGKRVQGCASKHQRPLTTDNLSIFQSSNLPIFYSS